MIIQSKKQVFEPVVITFENAKEFYDFLEDLKDAATQLELTETTYNIYEELQKL